MTEDAHILVLNSGSSSLKVGLFGNSGLGEQLVLLGEANGVGRGKGNLELKDSKGTSLLREKHIIGSQDEALEHLVSSVRRHRGMSPIAVGHRVVHGGPVLREHLLITPEVLLQLGAATHLAPLHIPESLSLIHKAQQLFPNVPQIACFDTIFHNSMPEVATHLPLPVRYYSAGVRRYGFHGLSCESVLNRIPSPLPARLVIAHLGGGSSVTAVLNGRSVDTSMGLSPTGGVPMSLRTGDIDPSVLLYLLRTENFSADDLESLINHECGLFGFSNGEGDMQALLSRDDPAAKLAISVYTTSIRKAIGSYVAVLGGIDLLIFTGGIGQHSTNIRQRILSGLEFLGLREGSTHVAVLASEEEIQMARHCRRLSGLSRSADTAIIVGEVKSSSLDV